MAAGNVIQDMGPGGGRPYTTGEAIAKGDMVALTAAGLAMKANAIVGATQQAPCVGIAYEAAGLGEQVEVKHLGEVEVATDTFTEGEPLYLAETDGNITHTAPVTSGDIVQVVGQALTARIWRLHIAPNYTTVP
jgi:hypothetical protein